MNQIIELSPIASLAPFLTEGELVAFNVGPDGLVYLVVALRPLDYKIEQEGWAVFPKTMPDEPQKYRVISLSRDTVFLDVLIESERFNIHHVQPLADELLLVCARSHYGGEDDYEKNGRVYAREGNFKRAILLGDGIQSVQTTSDGRIWTSFFDEGVFGNFGWQEPVGASGLVAWDSGGSRIYEFQPTEELEVICDCYALNVASDEDIWFYYYTQFPLVHLHKNAVEAFWEMPIAGSDAFAVSGGYALFRGGYNESGVFYLFDLRDEKEVKLVKKIEIRDENHNDLIAQRVRGRADAIYFISEGHLYRLSVQAACE